MLILIETSIKTTFLFLLFTVAASFLPVAGAESKNQDNNILRCNETGYTVALENVVILSDDTIKPVVPEPEEEVIQQSEFDVPDIFTNQIFEFQINADITYRKFSHFTEPGSGKLFFQAWLKEKELSRISAKADSLRRAYASSPDDQKEGIAARILKNEELVISLNQEVSALYQAAREREDQYWKTATQDEINRFKEKIRLIGDSIAQSAERQKAQTQPALTVPDTIILHTASPKAPEVKAEPGTGIIYKVQIGAYRGKTPDLAAKLIKKLSLIRKIENYKDEKGVTVYTTGNLKSYQEAVTMQAQVKQEGARNAIVAAYQNGKRITLEAARKINKEL